MQPSDVAWTTLACDEDYSRDRAYSCRFDGAIAIALRSVRAPLRIVRIATHAEDTRRATDAVASVAVAYRIRRPKFLRYSDVTIRSWRDGVDTEIDKMFVQDHCEIYFYGTALNDNGGIAKWVALDLVEVRSSLRSSPGILGPEIRNTDGHTGFRPLRVTRLPSTCILAEHEWRDIPCDGRGIDVNGYRVFRRTDGPFIVFDYGLPPGESAVDGRTFASARAAVEFASRLPPPVGLHEGAS